MRPTEVILLEIYVGNLSFSIDDARLTALFSAHGNVERAKVVMDRDSGKSRGFGFVTMSDQTAGQKAIQALNGTESEGRTLNVRIAEDRSGGGQRAQGGGGGGGGRGGYDRR